MMPKTITERTKAWYHRNKDKARERDRKRREDRRRWFREEVLSKYSCTRCSENHPGVLDFHHLDPSIKLDSVGHMLGKFTARKVILAEIEKCICLCANCHRKHHWEENNK